MRIKDVEVVVLQAPGEGYRAPEDEAEAFGIKYLALVKVTTDSGLVGYSDIETQPHVAKAIVECPSEGATPGFQGLRSVLLGEDPLEVERLWHKMYMASVYYGRRGAAIQVISGIDIALWDIIGKALGLPVYKLLGGGHRTSVRAYASTLFRPTPEAMSTACQEYLDQGFTAVKFGWGIFGQNRKTDLCLVEAARRRLGDEVELLIDPGWYVPRTAKEAIEMIVALEPYRPFFVEDFLHPEDYDGYRRVSQAVNTRLAAGEQESTEWGFQQLIERGQVDVLQPDLSRCGGFTTARKIVHLVEMHHRLCVPHSWCSDLLTAASLHLNAFLQRSLFVEFNTTTSPLNREICRNPIVLKEGFLDVPQEPGLGVLVDEEALSRYRCA